MASVRILVVANRLPYPIDDGWKRRTLHVLRAVAAHGQVTLATLHAGPPEHVAAFAADFDGALEVVTARPARGAGARALALGVLTSRPYPVWKLRSAALRAAIERAAAVQPYDIAVATMAHLFPYLAHAGMAAKRVVDTHNIDSVVMARYAAGLRAWPRRTYARLTVPRLRRHEAEVFSAADRVWVCSDPEVPDVLARAPRARVVVIPNGVDATGEFSPPADARPEPRRLLFFGRLDYQPNADAIRFFLADIWPRVRAERPDAEFWVAGPGADGSIRQIMDAPGCRLVGIAPDLPGLLATAAVVVVPLRMGGGTRLKILEALAMARGVVSTRVGAEGLRVEDGRDLLLADEPPAFATNVVRLLDDPAAAAALGGRGRASVLAAYDWRSIESRIRADLELLVPRRA